VHEWLQSSKTPLSPPVRRCLVMASHVPAGPTAVPPPWGLNQKAAMGWMGRGARGQPAATQPRIASKCGADEMDCNESPNFRVFDGGRSIFATAYL